MKEYWHPIGYQKSADFYTGLRLALRQRDIYAEKIFLIICAGVFIFSRICHMGCGCRVDVYLEIILYRLVMCLIGVCTLPMAIRYLNTMYCVQCTVYAHVDACILILAHTQDNNRLNSNLTARANRCLIGVALPLAATVPV